MRRSSIVASWTPTTLVGLGGRAVIAPGFASALRRSELLNPSWSRWDGSPLASGAVPVSSLYQVRLRETHRGSPRRGADLIEDWRTKEVRHAEANPTEAGS